MRQALPPAHIMMSAASNSPILMMSPGANPELSNIGRITSAWLGRGSCGQGMQVGRCGVIFVFGSFFARKVLTGSSDAPRCHSTDAVMTNGFRHARSPT
jgi:hypothetical protein